ncbi:phosphatase PAP2 family protein [Vibrio sp. 99-70-13A1]|uniref:phosphatase PAP2 family protein n=1 Tax=Vibrio sp. 99-70-13A1 TaxID=2607601 RepID=UPI001493B594|nr:phosphatase PAP2 family protein [Vibrio sp. 99-70-13A1]NOH98284.1 phosphatase PAP2 family protein [Vibrio sp. 99-70-13A1]
MINYIAQKSKGLLLLAFSLYSLLPVVLIGIDVDLGQPVGDFVGRFMTLLTDSAGSSGFLVTLTVLSALALRLKFPRIKFLSLAIQLSLLLVICFSAKTFLKHSTESPRPYTEYLAQVDLIELPESFYQLSLSEKNEVIMNVKSNVSEWRVHHWLGEQDYSFPSGHTIFVAICIAFFGGLFFENRKFTWVAGLMIWAAGVAYSRLWLGMHRPEDLIGSVVLAALIYLMVPKIPIPVLKQYLPTVLFNKGLI